MIILIGFEQAKIIKIPELFNIDGKNGQLCFD